MTDGLSGWLTTAQQHGSTKSKATLSKIGYTLITATNKGANGNPVSGIAVYACLPTKRFFIEKQYMAKTVEKILQLFKWRNVSCLNGGEKNNKGECRCQKYFTGPECQYIQCLYGGTVILPENKTCLCPDEYHYRGRHCETIICENGGNDNGQGGCDCLPDCCLGLFITVIAF
ncbi:Protein irg-7 [Trichinella pseudospiralis]